MLPPMDRGVLGFLLKSFLFFFVLSGVVVRANPDAKRLYDDLLTSYNRLIRPVSNNNETITVWMRLRLSQLIDLNLREQIMTTNVWVDHEWKDHKFQWDPDEYGGVTELYVPSEIIWLPDIVLYNNADGEYIITTMTKAVIHFDGKVVWNPPAIFKSSCEIDVTYFPFDQQLCFMKFGSWTYDGFQIDLKHLDSEAGNNSVPIGIDLKDYYPSVEWDIMDVPATRNEKFYPCCDEPYPDIYFNITIRRKTLFYTVNLIIPCVGLEYLAILVFYLPAYSGEKVALCISILLSQTMFFLLISEIIPSTSLALPLLGKFLLFSMLLVGVSVLVTIFVLNIHFRNPSTHHMAPWIKEIFIHKLPGILKMRVPKQNKGCTTNYYKTDDESDTKSERDSESNTRNEASIPKENGSGRSGCKEHSRTNPPCYIDASYNGLSSEDVSIEIVACLPPPPAATRNYKGSPTDANEPVATGEGRIGRFAIDKRNKEMAEESRSNSRGSNLDLMGKQSRGPANQKGFADKGGLRTGVRKDPTSKSKGGKYPDGRKSETTLRFSNLNDKRDNKYSSQTTRRINSGRLLFEASYDQLPECFHIGHNPEAYYPPEIRKAIHNVQFIHTHMVQQDKFNEIDDDWAFVAMVLDRLLLYIFFVISVIGTVAILFQSPYLYDTTEPIDIFISKVARASLGLDDDDI